MLTPREAGEVVLLAAVDDHLDHVVVDQFGGLRDALVERRHLDRGVGQERRHNLIDGARIDQRLVALHVDDDVDVHAGDDFGEPIGAGLMRGFCEPHAAAEFVHARRDAEVVGRDDHFAHG